MKARHQHAVGPRITRISQVHCSRRSGDRVSPQCLDTAKQLLRGNSISHQLSATNQSSGFALVVALVMVALMAVIAVGVLTTVSVERGTATSYSSRYQADLAAQNGLQAAAKTLAIAPFPSPAPSPWPSSITALDTFLVVRADGVAEHGITPTYCY